MSNATEKLNTPVTQSGKSQQEIYLELAKLSQQSFETRRNFEWKAVVGLWTGIGAITYFLLQHPSTLSCIQLVCLAVAYFAIILVWLFAWQPFVHYAHYRDKQWKHYYSHRAENRAALYPAEEANRSQPDPWIDPKTEDAKGHFARFKERWNRIKKEPSAWSQCALTPLLVIASFVLIWSNSSQPPITERNDRICVSGDNATKVIDRLTR